MGSRPSIEFPGPLTVFHEQRLPERAAPAGYAALIEAYRVPAPLPRTLSAIGERNRMIEKAGWRLFSPRYAPAATFEGHLTFALKHEGLDLAVLKRLFEAAGHKAVEDFVHAEPTGGYARRVWFLYEWLTGKTLDLPNAPSGTYVKVLNPVQQYAVNGVNSTRHRVRNNLPGTPAFCPLVFRTSTLNSYLAMNLAERAKEIVGAVPRDLLARMAAFLLLKDSRSSFAIEGERPPRDRVQRWGRAIGEAGRQPLDLDELLRLQRIVIGDDRFVTLGLRMEGGFVGEHDRETGAPLPGHIDARHEDLRSLIDGLTAFDRVAARGLDPVIAAAVLAFGFVYIHPFEDGNGRIHRYLIHHILAQANFNPPGVIFPISSAILDRMDEYARTLETYSVRLLPLIEWEPTERNNVRVLNETADFYRFFDATPHAEFLHAAVRQTIEKDWPSEAQFLKNYDRFAQGVSQIADMPERKINLLFRFLQRHDGGFSKRAQDKEFSDLTAEEIERIEKLYEDAFEIPTGRGTP